jgi:hypothetical protein
MSTELDQRLAIAAGWTRTLPHQKHAFHYEYCKRVPDWLPPNETKWYMSKPDVPCYSSFPEGIGLIFRDLVPLLSGIYIEIHAVASGSKAYIVHLHDYSNLGIQNGYNGYAVGVEEIPYKLCEVIAELLCKG